MPFPSIVPIMRTVFVSRDAARLDRVREALAAQVATMRAQANDAMRARMPETVDEWGIVGTPEQVLARIAEYRRRLGMTHLIATRLRIGGIDADALEESIHTLAEIVGQRRGTMTLRVLWPTMRWPDDWRIESEAVGAGVRAEFVDRFENVTDDQWRNCDGIVSGVDVPAEYPREAREVPHLRNAGGRLRQDRSESVGRTRHSGMQRAGLRHDGSGRPRDRADADADERDRVPHRRSCARIQGNWRPALNPYGRRLSACTFGVVGIGRIGTAAALRAKAFGMDVVFYDPYVSNGVDLALGVRRVHSLEELMRQSDVVSVHVPLSDQTRKLVGAEAFAAAKPGLILVNTARGEVIDLDALYDAMRDGKVQAAGLDVLPVEPADPNHPLIKAFSANEEWIAHRLVMTPHSAFFTPESVFDMRAKSARGGGDVPARRTHAELRERSVSEARTYDATRDGAISVRSARGWRAAPSR